MGHITAPFAAFDNPARACASISAFLDPQRGDRRPIQGKDANDNR